MFQFFFKYPIPVFTKGKLVLLGAWPGWVLPVLIVASVVGLGWLIRSRLPEAAPIHAAHGVQGRYGCCSHCW